MSDLKETYFTKIPLLDNFFYRLLKVNREKIHDIFKKHLDYSDNDSLIDVGTTPSLNDSHNLILQKTINNNQVTSFSNLDCKILHKKFSNIKEFITGNAIDNNLPDKSFEIVYSSATIEHVGSKENQLLFVSECVRIAKKSVFITTPNRYFPFDLHTKIPFIHFLPKNLHRRLLKIIGLSFFSMEENLNLLSKKDLINICKKLRVKNFYIVKHKFCFFTSNLILIINK